MYISSTLLLMLGASAQDASSAAWLDEPETRPEWWDGDFRTVVNEKVKQVDSYDNASSGWDKTCPDQQVYSIMTGLCMNKNGFAENKPRCTAQGRWSNDKRRCIRNCYKNRYFYPSSTGTGRCYTKQKLLQLADPLCRKEGKRYDVVDAMCIGADEIDDDFTAREAVRRPTIPDYQAQAEREAERRAFEAQEAAERAAAAQRAADRAAREQAREAAEIREAAQARRQLLKLKKMREEKERKASERRFAETLARSREAERRAKARREAIRRQYAKKPVKKAVRKVVRRPSKPIRVKAEPIYEAPVKVHSTSVAPPQGVIWRDNGSGIYEPTNQRIETVDPAWEGVEKQSVEWLTPASSTTQTPTYSQHQHSPSITNYQPSTTDVNPWETSQLVLTDPKCRQRIKFTKKQKACIKSRCPRKGSLVQQKRCHARKCGVKSTQYGKNTCTCRGNQKWSRKQAKCIGICPSGYRFNPLNADKPCIRGSPRITRTQRRVTCGKGYYASKSSGKCRRTPTCGVGQRFNSRSELCAP